MQFLAELAIFHNAKAEFERSKIGLVLLVHHNACWRLRKLLICRISVFSPCPGNAISVSSSTNVFSYFKSEIVTINVYPIAFCKVLQ